MKTNRFLLILLTISLGALALLGIKMKDYSDLGLTSDLRSASGISSQKRDFVTAHDFGVNYQVPTGGLNYTQLNFDTRPYKAIVTLSKTQGTFDDIQMAINYVNGLGGGVVFIKSGTYTPASDITLYSNITLVGEDDDATIIDFENTDTEVLIIGSVGSYKENVTISNLQFKRRRGTDNGVIHADKVSKLTIRKCYFTDNWKSDSSYGIDIFIREAVGASKDVIIEDNKFVSSGGGIEAWDVTNLQIRGNRFYDCDDIAINPQSSGHIRIVNNLFDSCNDYILYSTEDVYYLVFANNNIRNHKAVAISMGSLNYSVISGNIFMGGVGSGDCIYGGGSFADNTVIGNVICNFGSDGIDIDGGDWNTIIGNRIYGCGAWGVDLDANTSKSTVVGNSLQGNTSGAVNDNGTGNDVAHNTS